MFRTVAIYLLCIIAIASAFGPAKMSRASVASTQRFVKMEAGPGEIFVPDMPRRNTMNAILVGAVGVSALGLAVPYISFFVPAGGGGGGGGTVAKDALGNDVTVAGWKSSHNAGARELVQGLKGDATYLILDDQKNMADFAVNAVCTHLGCVVPWNKVYLP